MRLVLSIAAAIGALSLTSCVVRAHPMHEVTVVESGPRAEVVVTEAPPPLRVEERPVAPSANHVWIQGYWTRHDGAWFWVAGGWHPRPRHGAEWVVGHWEARPGRWVWVPGHWRYV